MKELFFMSWWVFLINIAWSLALGMIWYSPRVFYDIWRKAEELSEDKVKQGNPGQSMLFGLLANTLCLYALGVMINLTKVSSLAGGAGVGLLISLGLITTSEINNGSFRQAKPAVYLINGGYRLLMMVVAGALFARWG